MNPNVEILSGLKSGDEKAYMYLYAYHYKVLCAVAYEYVNDFFVAEMIVSDVIYSLWLNKEVLDINQSLRGYLVKAVSNRCINYLNRKPRQVDVERCFGHSSEEEPIDHDAYPLTKLIEKELDGKINEGIDALPPLTREIFCLSRFQHLKYDQIAKKKNVSVDVVKYHIKSALSRLKEKLKDYLVILLVLLTN